MPCGPSGIREADGTVVFSLDSVLTGGNSLTFEYAVQVSGNSYPQIGYRLQRRGLLQGDIEAKGFYRIKPNRRAQRCGPKGTKPAWSL